MGLPEEVGSPFMLEGHSHWAPSSVWRKELPSCLLWQNLPEDSDTIAHLAPCFLSFFFFHPTEISHPHGTTVSSQPFDMCQMRLNWPRPLPAQLTFWRALDYVRTQTQIPSHTYWFTWGSGTHQMAAPGREMNWRKRKHCPFETCSMNAEVWLVGQSAREGGRSQRLWGAFLTTPWANLSITCSPQCPGAMGRSRQHQEKHGILSARPGRRVSAVQCGGGLGGRANSTQ